MESTRGNTHSVTFFPPGNAFFGSMISTMHPLTTNTAAVLSKERGTLAGDHRVVVEREIAFMVRETLRLADGQFGVVDWREHQHIHAFGQRIRLQHITALECRCPPNVEAGVAAARR